MTNPLRITLAITVLAIAVGVVAVAQNASRARVEYPQNYRDNLSLYAVVNRPDGKIYELFINQVALESWRTNRSFPNGSVFVVESFVARRNADGSLARDPQGRLIKDRSENEIHVSEKQANWERNSEITSNNWRVGAFDPRNGQRVAGVDLQACHTCHTDRNRNLDDFTHSWGLLSSFATSGEVRRFTCRTPEREVC